MIHQRLVASDWVEGGTGIITFEDCCDCINADPEHVREGIRNYCNKMKRKPQRLGVEYIRKFLKYDTDEQDSAVVA